MNDSIVPSQIMTVIDRHPAMRLLSLDCFDTLLWRVTPAPRDVFTSLAGITPEQRIWAEQRARRAALVRHGRSEVGIDDIYAAMLPNAAPAERAAYVARELAAEAAHCFAFAPTVELMRDARRRGLPVIIVSDTYLDQRQLAELIRAAAGDDVLGLIDRIFCSSEHGVSKSEGLFRHVLAAMDASPASLLHIGDNRAADVVAPTDLGIRALHLRQFSDAAHQRLRLEAAVGAVIGRGGAIAACQTHRAAVALGEPMVADTTEALGYSVLGPVLDAFATWLSQSAQRLAAERGGRVHPLFLMRDGYLPLRAFEARGGMGLPIEISRFAATAASFDGEAAIRRFIEQEIGGDPAAVLRQLLFQPREIATALRSLPSRGHVRPLIGFLLKPRQIATITRRSRSYAERLVEHVRRATQALPGDTLMLVDLGYNGSVQNYVEPLLRAALEVEVAGRYLLLREQECAGFDKQGFIASPDYDGATLEALCGNVAVLEQLCSAAQGSVVDYRPDGTPIRAVSRIKGGQSAIRDRVQDACVRFARDQADPAFRSRVVDPPSSRHSAIAVLARLMFLPMPGELAALTRFDHDVNLGTSGTVKLFDPEVARRGLQERGMFYLKDAERMYLPAEVRGNGLPLSLTLLTQRRFGLDLRHGDFCDATVALPLLVADGREVTVAQVGATPTHDGYMSATIPVGASRFAIGIQFGQLYEWVEITSVSFAPVDALRDEAPPAEPIAARPTLEGMSQEGPFLFRCDDRASFMMVSPPPGDQQMLLTVCYRPLALRSPADQLQPATAVAGRA